MSLFESAGDVDLQSSLSGKAIREKWLKRRTTIKVKVNKAYNPQRNSFIIMYLWNIPLF